MTDSITWRRATNYLRFLCALAFLAVLVSAIASEYHGQITFNGLAVPGETITATQGTTKFITISDQMGNYNFADLPDGAWKIEVEMRFFAPIEQAVTVAPNEPAIRWELAARRKGMMWRSVDSS